MTRLRLDWTKSWLDYDSKKFEMTLTRRACDSDSTKMSQAHHWYAPTAESA